MRSLLFSSLLLAGIPSLPAETPPAPKSIEHLVSQTLTTNPEIRFYEAEVAKAKADRSTAGRQGNPTIDLQVGKNRVYGPDGSSDGLAFSASLAQPIEWPGRLGLRKAIANRDIMLAELGLERFRFHLASRVRVLAYSLAAQQDVATAAKAVAGRYASLREVMVQREPAGIAPQLEIVTIEAAALVAESSAAKAAVAVQQALLELNQLMGRRADTPLVVLRAAFEMKSAASLDSLLLAAMQNHYDLRIRQAELEQQGFKVELAKNERYPTITVGPFIQQQNAPALENQSVFAVGVSFPLPFWKNGKAAVTAAEARQMQAQSSLSTMQREVERQVTASMLLFQTQQARLVLWKNDTMSKFSNAAELADRHYRLGAVPMATFVELQDKYLAAVEAINETQIQALEAALSLEALTGSPGSLVILTTAKP
ncbi:MAG: TolC family protein [Verrucomicrobiales bacterium]|nr:TolC family protein [Verrucomicrobiales bacterium]MCP5560191.1 TolC family protein [Verrucomicrobiaceae bacterium]